LNKTKANKSHIKDYDPKSTYKSITLLTDEA
jgi:hypothetical protein